MAATEPLYLRLAPGLKDRITAAARRDGVSANEWAQETLRRALADSSLATGVGSTVSAGLPDVSAPVASDVPPTLSLPVFGAGGGPPAKTAAEVAALVKSTAGVTTGGDLARAQVTPLPKGGKR